VYSDVLQKAVDLHDALFSVSCLDLPGAGAA
jgi:hypothetical protein